MTEQEYRKVKRQLKEEQMFLDSKKRYFKKEYIKAEKNNPMKNNLSIRSLRLGKERAFYIVRETALLWGLVKFNVPHVEVSEIDNDYFAGNGPNFSSSVKYFECRFDAICYIVSELKEDLTDIQITYWLNEMKNDIWREEQKGTEKEHKKPHRLTKIVCLSIICLFLGSCSTVSLTHRAYDERQYDRIGQQVSLPHKYKPAEKATYKYSPVALLIILAFI